MKNETLGLLLGVLFLFSAAALADTHIPGGFVSGTWTLAGSPYILDSSIVVNQDSTLTIEPGVDVLIAPARRFRIEGQILAVGTMQDSIRFIATDTAQGSESLDFLNTNLSPRDSSRLVYCQIKYGTASPYPDPYMHGGGLYIKNSSRLLVSHCTISHCRTRNVIGANGANGYNGNYNGGPGQPGQTVTAGGGGGIYCEDSSPSLTFNIIAINHTGDGLGGNGGNGGDAFNYSGSAHGGNGGQGGYGNGGNGGAIYLKNSAAVLYGNCFFSNYAGFGYGGQGGAGGFGWAPYDTGIGGDGAQAGSGYGGSGGAIVGEPSQAIFSNNLVYENRTGNGYGSTGGNGGAGYGAWHFPGGGGVGGYGFGGYGFAIYSMTGSFYDIHNCTITRHNVISMGQGGLGGMNGNGTVQAPSGQGYWGLGLVLGPDFAIANSIIWNNTDPTISFGATVTYSCIQGGFPGMGNISSNPLFVSAPQGSYFLSQIAAGQSQQSPCVDAGNPTSAMLIGTTRTDGIQDAGIVDMGYHYPLGTPQSQITMTLTPHNPPIVIPPSGGSFRFDIRISYSEPPTIDFWIVITLPDSTPQTSFLRENITLPPSGIVFRPNLTQYIPAAAPPGSYLYTGHIRDHETWEELDSDSFSFTKLPGEDSPAHDFGWNLLGWDEDVAAGKPFPTEIRLLGNYPNPFNATTAISYQLSAFSHVRLGVYDTAGRLVATLVDGWREAGVHSVVWDVSKMPSGIYFYRLQAGTFSEVKKMVLVK